MGGASYVPCEGDDFFGEDNFTNFVNKPILLFFFFTPPGYCETVGRGRGRGEVPDSPSEFAIVGCGECWC